MEPIDSGLLEPTNLAGWSPHATRLATGGYFGGGAENCLNHSRVSPRARMAHARCSFVPHEELSRRRERWSLRQQNAKAPERNSPGLLRFKLR
jgi:hypothetical protein